MECRSASCGTCWVGILGGAEKLSDVAAREGKKIKEFGYIDTVRSKTADPPRLPGPGTRRRLDRDSTVEWSVWEVFERLNATRSAEPTKNLTQDVVTADCARVLTPLLFVLAAAFLWSTGGLFIKWNTLSGLELSFGARFLR